MIFTVGILSGKGLFCFPLEITFSGSGNKAAKHQVCKNQAIIGLGAGGKYFLFFPLFGEDFPFDQYFQMGWNH